MQAALLRGPSPLTPGTLASPQLLSAASLFQLDALQRHCEILCSQTLSVDSAVSTYKYAKVRPGRPPATPGLAPAPARLGRAAGGEVSKGMEGAGGVGSSL